MLDQFMDSANEIDIRMAAEQPAVLMRDVGGSILGSRMTKIVRHAHPVPAAVETAGHVVTNGSDVTPDFRRIQQRRYAPLCVTVQFLVRIQHQNPIRGHRRQRRVARVGEMVLPRDGKNLGAEFLSDLNALIRGAGIGNDDLAHDSANTLQTWTERVRTVLHDHRESDARHNGFLKISAALENRPVFDQATTMEALRLPGSSSRSPRYAHAERFLKLARMATIRNQVSH